MNGPRQHGQAAAEYLLIVVLVMLGLCLPLGNAPPLAAQLAIAIANFFNGYSFLIAIA